MITYMDNYPIHVPHRDLKTAVEMYTEAVDVAKGDVASETAALNNRAAAHMKLGNYGYALQDSLRAGRLSKNNVKAHYRASVSATKLEKLDVALLSTESGMKACKSGHGTSADAKLLKQQKQLIAETRKKIEERERRQREQRSKLEDVSSMFARRNIQVRRVEYAQQAEYERTKPHLVDDEWCWPVLLVYQSQNHGEQSDYLASVNENVTLSEIIDLVFGQDTQPPWWDVDNAYEDTSNLRVLVRTNEDYDDDNSDSDDGWTVNEHVKWMPLGNEETIGEVVCRKHYKVPLYPVLHIVPRVIAKNLNNL